MSLVQRSPGLHVVAAACVGSGRVIRALLGLHGLWVHLSPSPVVLWEAVGQDEAVRVLRVLPAESLECLLEKTSILGSRHTAPDFISRGTIIFTRLFEVVCGDFMS